MSTIVTTLKLPSALKRRLLLLARRSGRTPHAWMIDALAAQAAREEARDTFLEDAAAAAEAIDDGGPVYAMEDVHAWLRAKVAGGPARRPRPLRRGGR